MALNLATNLARAGAIASFGVLATLIVASGTWGALAISTQRLHDIGRSGPSLLLLLIPVLGPLWVLLLLCRRGGEGKNRYGDDPLSRHDYLQVNIAK